MNVVGKLLGSIQFNEKKEFDAILGLIKRETPNDFGHMLHYSKE